MRRPFKPELLLLALVCFGPVLGAYLLYYYGDLGELPRISNEERRLFEPAVELPALPVDAADGERFDNLWSQPAWSLIYARRSPCDDACRGELVRLSQVHLSLGRDQDRVQRVYLGPAGEALLSTGHVNFNARLDTPAAEHLLELLDSLGEPPGDRGRIYVADPHGNLVLSYPPDAGQEGLRDDLDRLLDVSRIG